MDKFPQYSMASKKNTLTIKKSKLKKNTHRIMLEKVVKRR